MVSMVLLQVARQAVPCQLTSSRVCEVVEEYRQAWVKQDPARTEWEKSIMKGAVAATAQALEAG